MDRASLIVGRTYYLVTFADVERTMPGIDPLVYIGVDVFGPQPDGGEPNYYFQYTPSFSMFGMATEENPPVRFEGEEHDEEPEYFVTGHEAREIGWAIVDLPGALEEVKKAAERASRLGYPVLKRTSGKWYRIKSSGDRQV